MNHPHNLPGYLIAIEGIDGAGKTTVASHVQEILQSQNLPVIRTKEPTNGQYGQILRSSANSGRLSLEEEIELFIKDRREHVEKEIFPALEQEKVVIVDRYYFSNMAYQGARGADPDAIRRDNEAFAPEPDLLVILDLDPARGLERIKTRGGKANHFEEADALRKVRQIFLEIRKPYLRRLDATLPAQEIQSLIVRHFFEIVTARARAGAIPSEKLRDALRIFVSV